MLATTVFAAASIFAQPAVAGASPKPAPNAHAANASTSAPAGQTGVTQPASAAILADAIGQAPILPDATLAALSRFTPIAQNVWRVDGPADILIEVGERSGVTTYRYDTRMLVDTKLPVAYPQPTPPDVIEIKAYPSVRRAEVSGTGNPDMGMNIAFWPLFRHIDRNAIAMTAPVEIDYRVPELPSLEDQVRPEGWTMSFLYERETDGPAGDFGNVDVVDREPVLVLAIGLRGSYRYSRMNDAMARLNDWLAAHPEWVVAGDPRMMGYNGPDRRPADQWSEMQIPIALAAPVAGAAE